MRKSGSNFPNVLLVTDVPFWRADRGSRQRIQTLHAFLESFSKTTVCFIGELSVHQWGKARATLGNSLVGPGAAGRFTSSIAARLPDRHRSGAISDPAPAKLSDFASDVIAEFVCRYIAKHPIDVVLLEYVTLSYLATAIKKLKRPPLVLIDTHDVMHQRCESFAERGLEHWLQVSEVEEIKALSQSDVVLAIQEQDADHFRSRLREPTQVCLAKHATRYFGKVEGSERKTDRFGLGFLGSKGIANRESLNAFVQQSWGRLRQEFGDRLDLTVAGGISVEDLRVGGSTSIDASQLEIRFLGPMKNLSEFFRFVDCTINPAITPSGMKVKTVESFAHGTPVVATSHGLAGVDSAVGRCAIKADDWDEFTTALRQLIRSPTQLRSLSRNCRTFVDGCLRPEVVYAELKQTIESRSGRST